MLLSGPPGIGKTTEELSFLTQLKKRFNPSAINLG